MTTISVARDFTRFPSGRYKRNGGTSGEAFRERFLQEPVSRGLSISVELDGTLGYGSSFLEEAFGGLVRALRLPPSTVLERLSIVTADPALREEVQQYIREAGDSLK